MKHILLWFKKWFGVLTIEECKILNLTFSHNIYGDGINHLNCRSIWRDDKGKSYRCESLHNENAPATDTGDHENKQTAVEWLEEALAKNLKQIIYKCDHELMESLFKQAKEMERKQHQNTWDNSIPFLSFDDYFTKKYNNGKEI